MRRTDSKRVLLSLSLVEVTDIVKLPQTIQCRNPAAVRQATRGRHRRRKVFRRPPRTCPEARLSYEATHPRSGSRALSTYHTMRFLRVAVTDRMVAAVTGVSDEGSDAGGRGYK